jgi:hypothetical protein
VKVANRPALKYSSPPFFRAIFQLALCRRMHLRETRSSGGDIFCWLHSRMPCLVDIVRGSIASGRVDRAV